MCLVLKRKMLKLFEELENHGSAGHIHSSGLIEENPCAFVLVRFQMALPDALVYQAKKKQKQNSTTASVK